MHVEGVDGQRGLSLSESIEVDVGDDEAWRAAIRVLEDSLKIALNWDVWPCQAMEHWDLLVLLEVLVVIIWLSHPLKKRAEESDHFWHHTWTLLLCYGHFAKGLMQQQQQCLKLSWCGIFICHFFILCSKELSNDFFLYFLM